MAQAVECLPSMYKSLVQNAETNTHTPQNPKNTTTKKPDWDGGEFLLTYYCFS
jgi:hypothetical protein